MSEWEVSPAVAQRVVIKFLTTENVRFPEILEQTARTIRGINTFEDEDKVLSFVEKE